MIAKFLGFCDENQIMLPGNYLQYRVVCIPNKIVFAFFHIQGLHIFASTLSDFRQSIRLT
jgi:hypothetical protein